MNESAETAHGLKKLLFYRSEDQTTLGWWALVLAIMVVWVVFALSWIAVQMLEQHQIRRDIEVIECGGEGWDAARDRVIEMGTEGILYLLEEINKGEKHDPDGRIALAIEKILRGQRYASPYRGGRQVKVTFFQGKALRRFLKAGGDVVPDSTRQKLLRALDGVPVGDVVLSDGEAEKLDDIIETWKDQGDKYEAAGKLRRIREGEPICEVLLTEDESARIRSLAADLKDEGFKSLGKKLEASVGVAQEGPVELAPNVLSALEGIIKAWKVATFRRKLVAVLEEIAFGADVGEIEMDVETEKRFFDFVRSLQVPSRSRAEKELGAEVQRRFGGAKLGSIRFDENERVLLLRIVAQKRASVVERRRRIASIYSKSTERLGRLLQPLPRYMLYDVVNTLGDADDETRRHLESGATSMCFPGVLKYGRGIGGRPLGVRQKQKISEAVRGVEGLLLKAVRKQAANEYLVTETADQTKVARADMLNEANLRRRKLAVRLLAKYGSRSAHAEIVDLQHDPDIGDEIRRVFGLPETTE